MVIRMVLAGMMAFAVSASATAAHGGGGGAAISSGGGGGGGGGEAVILKKPVQKKKEYDCFHYLLARSDTDAVCRILYDATYQLGEPEGLRPERHGKLLERLMQATNGLKYIRLLPEPGPSTQPNWCELKRKMTGIDAIIVLEKKRKEENRQEAVALKEEEAQRKAEAQKKTEAQKEKAE